MDICLLCQHRYVQQGRCCWQLRSSGEYNPIVYITTRETAGREALLNKARGTTVLCEKHARKELVSITWTNRESQAQHSPLQKKEECTQSGSFIRRGYRTRPICTHRILPSIQESHPQNAIIMPKVPFCGSILKQLRERWRPATLEDKTQGLRPPYPHPLVLSCPIISHRQ